MKIKNKKDAAETASSFKRPYDIKGESTENDSQSGSRERESGGSRH